VSSEGRGKKKNARPLRENEGEKKRKGPATLPKRGKKGK